MQKKYNMKFRILACLAFLCNGILYSQKVPDYPKKIYISPDHKIYYNKSLPVYFYVSSSPDPNAPHYLLPSEGTSKYANPMYFDTEGKNTLRSPYAVDTASKQIVYPKIDVQFEVYADSKPPVTILDFDKQKEIQNKGVHLVPDSIVLNLMAKDELSGVENTYISIDSGAYIPMQHVKLEKEKSYFIQYFSVDNTGNVENVKSSRFAVDKTPPVSSLEIKGEKYQDIINGRALLTLQATDNISGVKHIYYSIDDSVFKVYSLPISTSMISQGEHTIFYYSVDLVGNQEMVHVYHFYVDNTPPQVIEEIQGKTFNANGREFSAGTAKLKITAIDNKSGVKEIYYSINNKPFEKYEKPVVLSGYKGDLIVKSYAVDNVGNQSQNDLSNSRKATVPYIDLTGPVLNYTLNGPHFQNQDTLYINYHTHIVLQAKDDESGVNKVEYQIDNGDLITYQEPFNILSQGFHHIAVFGYDNIDNMSRIEINVMTDTIGPEIFVRFSSLPFDSISINGKNMNRYKEPVVIFLSATDAKSGFHSISYSLNNKPYLPYTGNIQGFIHGKTNVLNVKAFDNLGNQSHKTIEFYIK